MEIVQAFINEYGTAILYAILTGVAAALGAWLKKIYTKKVNLVKASIIWMTHRSHN